MGNRKQLLSLYRLGTYLIPFWKGLGLSALLGALTIISSIALMASSAWLIAAAALQPSIAELSVAVVAVRFLGLVRGVLRYLERVVSHDTTFRLLADWRVRFFRAIEPLAPARLMDQRGGDLLGRMVKDIDTLQEIYLRAIAPPLVAAVVGVVIVLIFAFFDPLVSLVLCLSLVAGGVVFPAWLWNAGRRRGPRLMTARSELSAELTDILQGMGDAKVYGCSEVHMARLDRLSAVIAKREREAGRHNSLIAGLGVLFANGTALAVLAVAIPRVEGIFLAALVLAVAAAFEAFIPLTTMPNNVETGLAAAARVFSIVDLKPAVSEVDHSSPLPRNRSVEFDRVVFRYTADSPPVLDGVSFSIPEGQHTAILGESGAGKSSLVNLLVRFWDYQGGAIRVGGHDLRCYSTAYLRQMIGVMAQRVHLFNTSILENIRLARLAASDEEVIAAAKQAEIHDFINSLPERYNTPVGENGARLSVGEQQRIALARVLLKDSPLLLLDEPTAHLDALTERSIMETIYSATRGRTLLLLTHRLVLPEQVDVVLELRDGKIAEPVLFGPRR